MPTLPKMHPVWVDAENTRVYGMDHDEERSIWFTGSLAKLHRYWPKAGKMETIPIPGDHGGSQCICAGGKVYVLPQLHPKITVYDVAAGRVRLLDKPFPEANIWWGHKDARGELLYLQDRSRPCLAVWDVAEDRCEVFSYPAAGTLPSIREADWPERLEACWVAGEPTGYRVYFDPEVRRFVAEDREAIPPVRPGAEAERYIVNYRAPGSTHPDIEGARLIRIDRRTGERYERDVPGWDQVFGFVGGGVFWRGWQLNCLSTYARGYQYDEKTGKYNQVKENPDIGVDGLPYHFMNRFIAYHPESDTFDFLVPDAPGDRYPQLCYNHVMDGELYITANDIFSKEKGRPLGAVERPVGQLMVLQSHPTER